MFKTLILLKGNNQSLKVQLIHCDYLYFFHIFAVKGFVIVSSVFVYLLLSYHLLKNAYHALTFIISLYIYYYSLANSNRCIPDTLHLLPGYIWLVTYYGYLFL